MNSNNMPSSRRRTLRLLPAVTVVAASSVALLLIAGSARGFSPPEPIAWATSHVSSRRVGYYTQKPSSSTSSLVVIPSPRRSSSSSSSTSLHMFMGSDGGILGIGGPELFTILLVGYFVLGPSDLYKLVKSIGEFVQNARTLSTDLTKTFESNMESQLQIEEIRKAQRELNDAFSFRRSINVDADAEAFATTVTTPREGLTEGQDIGVMISTEEGADASSSESSSNASPKKKKLKRRRRVQPEETVPDLQMPEMPETVEPLAANPTPIESLAEEELAVIDSEFDQYTSLEEVEEDEADASSAAQRRFQQQLTGKWNQQIVANSDVLTQVMQKLSLLEEEKAAATKRLEEEFEKRTILEEQFYQKQREVLESALRQVEKQVVGVASESSNNLKSD